MRDPADSIPLSPAGEQRRAMILAAALRETRRVRRRRAVRRVSVAAIVPLVILATLFATARHRSTTLSPPIAMPARTSPIPRSPIAPPPTLVDGRPTRTLVSNDVAVIRVVGDAPDIRARFARPAVTASSVRRVDDQSLLRTLDESGLQAGLATIGGTTLLYVDGKPVR